jgi:hypothetical protein
MIARLGAIAALFAAGLAAGADYHPATRYRLLAAPDCPGPANIIAEGATEPLNQTNIRVQHIGDLDTEELRNEVANEITWDVGDLTGLHVNSFYQRGYRDAPPPVAASAFQLNCERAGFLINSFQFEHSRPLFGEGPSASIGRTLEPPPVAFDDEKSTLAIQGWVTVPTSISPALTPELGVTAVSFFYYVRDTTTRTNIAHVVGLFDNRAAGSGGAGNEFLSNDGITAFAGSPLAAVDGTGHPVRFVEAAATSGTMRFANTWNEPAFFRAEIPFARFKAMLEALSASSLPGSRVSTDPRDYRVLFFGLLAEIFVGTTHEHDVMLGGNVRDLTLARERAQPRFGLLR